MPVHPSTLDRNTALPPNLETSPVGVRHLIILPTSSAAPSIASSDTASEIALRPDLLTS